MPHASTQRSRTLILVALAAFAGACESHKGTGDAALVSLEPIPAGEDCANGGVSLQTGVDDDGDGTLSDAEVDASETVCNGESGAVGEPGPTAPGAAIRTTVLPRGDDECPHGGVLVEAGQDDGSGGGIADDGTLQDGEVDDAATICNGAPAFDVASIDRPAGPPGTSTIDVSGGGGTDDCGGDGGALQLGQIDDDGLPGGNVVIFDTGAVDTSFTPPTASTSLGDVPFDVTTDTVVPSLADADCDGIPDVTDQLTVGQVFGISCEGENAGNLYRWDGEGSDQVTGLHVAADVTLTLPPPQPTTLGNPRAVRFESDVFNEGTITAPAGDTSTPGIALDARVFYGAPGSAIVIHGGGATLDIEVDTFLNAGLIDLDGAPGRSGGTIEIDSNIALWNTGELRASGTAAAEGEGAWGGDVELSAFGSLRNSGPITVRGAAAGSSAGGGGTVYLASELGDVVNSGDIVADGASAPASCSDCDGGWAYTGDPAVALSSDEGSVFSSGDISARGGDAGAEGAEGGEGGVILFVTGEGGEGGEGGSVLVSGNLDTSGGEGVEGGDGGAVVASASTDRSQPALVAFYGYTDVLASGGDSDSDCGGDGGESLVWNGCPDDEDRVAGGAVFATDLTARGGASTTGEGGVGGELRVIACDGGSSARYVGANVALIDGSVDVSGGASAEQSGGDGGYVTADAFEWVENRATVDLGGGDGADGGEGGTIDLECTNGQVTNTGAVDAGGGDGTADEAPSGGAGGVLFLGGRTVDNTAALSLDGGDAIGTDGVGGDGGEGELSSFAGTTINTGATSVAGGAGDTAGEPGTFLIDGFEVVTP